MVNFGEWLSKEISTRGWSESEFARRGRITAQAVNLVTNGQGGPGLKFCRATALALNMSVEDVMRLAGLFDKGNRSRPVRDSRRIVYDINSEESILALWRSLRVEDQERMRDLMVRLAPVVEPRIIGEEPDE